MTTAAAAAPVPQPAVHRAGVSITVLFFALSGVVFLSSQIHQFVLGYSPLAAGVRALPSAAALAVFSPLGSALARRAGVRVPVTLGLVAAGPASGTRRPARSWPARTGPCWPG